MGVSEHLGAILSHFNPILGHFRLILSHFGEFGRCWERSWAAKALRRRQNNGQGAAKAFGAVEMGVKMAQNGSKWLKIGPK